MNRKAAFISTLVIPALLVACGKHSGTGKDGNTAENALMEAEAAPAEIVFYTSNGDSEENFNRLYGEPLRKKFPQYTIKYILSGAGGQTLDTLLASKTRFDVFMQGPGFFESQAFPAGIQFDMSGLIRTHKIDLNRLDKASVDYVTQSSGNGKLYFLPVQLEGMVLYYNKSLFDKFGVSYPVDSMTWDQMLEKAKLLTRKENGVQYFGFGTNSSTIQGMNPLSIPMADIATDTPTINRDERWRTFYDYFYDRPNKIPGYLDGAKAINGIPTREMFVNDQTVAMFAYQSGLINVWEEQLKGLDWDMAALPEFPNQRGVGSMANPKLFGITSMAENKDAAMIAIRYLLSDEHQQFLARKGYTPILTSDAVTRQLGQDSIYKDRNWQSLVYREFAPLALRPAYYSQLNAIYQKHFKAASLGQTDLNTALRAAEEEAVKAIAEFKRK
ncbi:extracellular solute-binding protein [Paenibacillus mesophilus]|uniref:ABC transporter substrate-binding protein n=1 Tax=Paenibacillus mesophilus TaxID=2582849 RepID=UPI00110D6A23|nr:extracellular solute-binding protein [Paenibacillus mesophilus]TMV48665.1 extracellular solute-binding protein [Paenibacillus mesophilus]